MENKALVIVKNRLLKVNFIEFIKIVYSISEIIFKKGDKHLSSPTIFKWKTLC